MLEFTHKFIFTYSTEVNALVTFSKNSALNFINNLDFMPIYYHTTYITLYFANILFPGVNFVHATESFIDAFIIAPINSVNGSFFEASEAYFSYFETDFSIKLNQDIKKYIAKLLNKPYQADKDLSFILNQMTYTIGPKVTSYPLLSELNYQINVFLDTTIILVLFLSALAAVVFGFFSVFSFIVTSLLPFDSFSDDKVDNSTLLFESEKELGSIDDFIIALLCIAVIYSYYFGFFFIYTFGMENFLSLISCLGFPLLAFVVVSMPACLLYDCGSGFIAYLRGSSNTTIFSLEFMYDSLATSIMFIRLFIQNVRFLLIFFAYFELFEFVNNSLLLNEHSLAYFQSIFSFVQGADSTSNILFFLLLELPSIIIHGIYILGHLFYTFLSNFTCYVILLFWFFSFLYTMFYTETLECHFRDKRTKLLKNNKVN